MKRTQSSGSNPTSARHENHPAIGSLSRRAWHLAFAACFALAASHIHAQVISFTNAALGAGNTGGATVSATTIATGMSSGLVARGAGLAAGSGSSRYNSGSWDTSEALAISGTDYVSITVAPAANYTYTLTALAMTIGSSSLINNWSIYAGTPGFTSTTQLATGSFTAGSNAAITPSLGSGFSNITAATEIRLYAWGASVTSAQTFGPGNGQPLNVSGSTTLRSAGTLVWDGGQSANWSTYSGTASNQSNWNLNNLPTSSLVDALQFAGSTQTTTTNDIAGLTVGSIAFNSGASAFTNSGSSVTLNGAITNSSSNLQTINHAISLSSGTHSLDTTGANLTIGGTLGGAGGIAVIGGKTVTLSASNTYTGQTTVTSGTLALGASNVLANSGTVSVNGGTLNLATFSDTVAAVQLASGTIAGTTGTLTSGATYDVQSGSISAILAGSSGLTKSTAGTVTLSGSNTYTGTTTLASGTLQLGNANALGAAANSLALNGGTLNLSGNSVTVGALTGSSAAAITSVSAATFTVSVASGTSTYAGGIGGAAALTKSGAGTQILTGSNGYAGTTTVSAGTLIINGTVGNGGITVGSGGTLGGSITAGGTTTIQAGGNLSVGNSPGLGTFAALSLSGTTTIEFNGGAIATSGRGTSYDAINVTGNNALTYGGTLKLVFSGSVANNQTFDVFQLAGTSSGTFATVTLFGASGTTANLVLASGTWSGSFDLGYGDGVQDFAFNPNAGDLSVIPEPQTWALIGIGLALSLWGIRGRRRKA